MCFGATCPICCKSFIVNTRPSQIPRQTQTTSELNPAQPNPKLIIKTRICTECEIFFFPALKSWRGCGSHVPSVLSSVPEKEWCTCTPKFAVASSNGEKEYPPQAGTGTAASAEKNDEL
ncbi:hypothetical protein QBC44DRAFT_4937 [Cladorrhinum sp. PSN332]|nr:hypothetical protein QBC44DRAFT_4937 [Cladorrhinum sp. PSN332]